MEDIFKEKFYSIQLLNEPKLAKKLAVWCTSLFLILVVCTLLPWTQNFNSDGFVTALNQENRPQTVQSTIAGRIEKWFVHEGEIVKKGDTILVLTEVKDKYFDPQTTERLAEQLKAKEQSLVVTKEKVVALQNQILALKSGEQLSISKGRNKIIQSSLKVKSDSMDLIAASVDNETAKLQLERQEKLFSQGLKSLTEVEQKRLKYQETFSKKIATENKLNGSRQELLNSSIEINSIKAEYLDKTSKAESDKNSAESYYYSLEGEISKMKNEYKNLQIRNTFYAITAPQNGSLVRASKNGIGETIKEGEAVATIMPSKMNVAVELYVKPMDMPLISHGTKVRLQFDGWPAMVFSGWPNTSFGTFGGVIEVIDKIDTKGKYRILVVPDSEQEKWPELIPIGSGVYGWAMLNDVPIWFEIWRELNGFPPDYVDHFEKKSGEKKDSKNKSDGE